MPPDGFIKLKKPTKTLHIPEDFIVEWEDRKTECPEVRHDSVFVRLRSRASNGARSELCLVCRAYEASYSYMYVLL